jgi:Phytanoyl-CoA dioxygenase (PhyH)
MPAADGFVAPDLDEVAERAVESLRADGIAVARFEDLLGGELWHDAAADIDPFIRETEEAMRNVGDRPAAKEELIIRRFFAKGADDDAKPAFSLRDPWLRIAASTQLLDIVNSYRGQHTKLSYVDNWFTVPYPGADSRIASQRWHRDPEDAHVVKVFVYFSDVDAEAGPFEYVRGSSTGGRYGDLWPWGSMSKIYPPESELDAAVAPDDRVTVTGTAGTVVFCDTGGLHRGGFARTKPRILSTFTYLRPGAKKSRRRYDVDVAGHEGELPAQVRFALE